MDRKLIILALLLALLLTLAACNLPQGNTITPTSPASVTDTPAVPTNTAPVPLPPTNTAPPTITPSPTTGGGPAVPTPTTPPGGGLTLAMLKNATVHAPSYDRTVKLTDGTFTEGSPATYTVKMLDVYALGDLTGDGKPEAAVILSENGGGSGVFVSLLIMEYKNGQPYQTGEAELGDRPQVKAVDISQGVVHLNMQVVGPTDASCCPSLPETRNYWLFGTRLTLMRLTTTVNDVERIITVKSPSHWATVDNPFTVSGSVTILPFENTLSYQLYLTNGTKINEGTLTVTPGTGTAGTFSQNFNLSSAGITDWVIVQFVDTSAADGSIIAMNSVILRAR